MTYCNHSTYTIVGVKSNKMSAILICSPIDFSKAFDSINRENMNNILIVYGTFTEIVNTIFNLYKNTYSIVLSPHF